MPVALSSETLVNIAIAGNQTPSDAARLDGGASVVSWIDQGGGAAKLRLIGGDGAPLGTEISVGAAREVAVAALKGGGFVAVWTTDAGSTAGVQAQVFDATGAAVGAARPLYASTGEPPILDINTYGLEVTGLSDGGFAVAFASSTHDSWGSSSVTGHVLVAAADGTVEGREFRGGASGKMASGFDPQFELAELPGGQVFATWTAMFSGQGTSQSAALFDLSGKPIGATFQIGHRDFDQPAPGDMVAGKIAGLPSGDVAMLWGWGGRLWISIYDADSLAPGVTPVRTPPQEVASGPASAMALSAGPDGELVVTWARDGEIYGRMVGADGVPAGAAFAVGDVTAGIQDAPQVVGLGDGRILALWADQSGAGGDNDNRAVKAQVIWDGVAQKGTTAGDSMIGGGGDDAFAGLEGADTLRGGGGFDTLAGGPGADVFVLAADSSPDRIIDFSGASGDRLDLRDAQGLAVQDGILILDRATGRLTWDPDSDAGAALPALIAETNAPSFDRDDFAEGVRPDGVRILLANGGKAETVFDWGQERFEQTTSTFDAQGRVTTYFVKNDDGSTGQRWWDVQATQPWSTRAAEYAADGQLKAYAVTYEDGHTEVFQFDVTNSQPWTRNVDFYDAQGRQSVQAVAWDDGAAFERYVDTYDVQPWAYYIDNYKNGTLLNHTYYREDGSVWVG